MNPDYPFIPCIIIIILLLLLQEKLKFIRVLLWIVYGRIHIKMIDEPFNDQKNEHTLTHLGV